MVHWKHRSPCHGELQPRVRLIMVTFRVRVTIRRSQFDIWELIWQIKLNFKKYKKSCKSERKSVHGVPWSSFWPNLRFLSWAADRLRIDRSAGWGAAACSETIYGEVCAETANGFTDLEVCCFDFEWLETPDSEFLTMTLQKVHQMWPWGGIVDFDFKLDNSLVACFSMLCSLSSCLLRALSFELNAHHRHHLKCSAFSAIYKKRVQES